MARYTEKEQKLVVIKKASLKLDLLKYFLQTAFELKAVDSKTLSELTPLLGEVGRQLGGWQKQTSKQTPPV